jgi:hypothetical protein
MEDTHEGTDDQIEADPGEYQPPTVTSLGDLAALTRGGDGNVSDGVVFQFFSQP